MYPEQTAPTGAVSSGSTQCLPYRLLKHFSRREKQTAFVAFGALRVKLLKINVIYYFLSFYCSQYVSYADNLANSLDPDQVRHFVMVMEM